MNILDGLDVLKRVLEIDPQIPVIMFSAHADISVAIQAIRLGAYDFLEKIDEPQHQINAIHRALSKRQLVLENRNLWQAIQGQQGIDKYLLGQSSVMHSLRDNVLQLAQVDVDFVINGATGTGKEVVAKCLHDFSPRAKKPFVALNCGALTESVIESELFGHEIGAFTGAVSKRIGKIEYANGGTLFLDEIESMPASLQVRLLRVLQERSLQRLGGNAEIAVDIRVVSATKEDLFVAAQKGQFREDLYYRLNVASVDIPKLDQRKEDIAILFNHFVALASLRFKRNSPLVTGQLLQELTAKSWPGNVRELRNVAERWLLGIPQQLAAGTNQQRLTNTNLDATSLDEKVASYEREMIINALKANAGHLELTSMALKIPRKKLYLRMKKHQLDRSEFISI
jgi:two-component system C4-dicarboxylate transport response regulator DctD